MLDRIIHLSIKNKLIVVLLTLSIAGFGIFFMLRILLGVVLDIAEVAPRYSEGYTEIADSALSDVLLQGAFDLPTSGQGNKKNPSD